MVELKIGTKSGITEQKAKKRIEYSKIIVTCFFLASIAFTGLSYVLAFLGLNTVEGLSQTIVRTSWSVSGISFLAYAGQNGIRAWSKNKWLAKEQIKNSGNGADTYGGYDSYYTGGMEVYNATDDTATEEFYCTGQ